MAKKQRLSSQAGFGRADGDGRLSPERRENGPQRADGEEDAELMGRIARGDQRAFERLYDRYVRYVYSICLRVLRSAEDAEDATLDTFCKIWKEAERYDGNRASVLSYLVLLARSRAIDLRRARSARVKREQAHGPVRQPAGQDPSEAAYPREARERVHAALDKLPSAEREAVQLSFLEGLSHREIAERLGQPLGTTNTRIRPGLIQLRQTLRI